MNGTSTIPFKTISLRSSIAPLCTCQKVREPGSVISKGNSEETQFLIILCARNPHDKTPFERVAQPRPKSNSGSAVQFCSRKHIAVNCRQQNKLSVYRLDINTLAGLKQKSSDDNMAVVLEPNSLKVNL